MCFIDLCHPGLHGYHECICPRGIHKGLSELFDVDRVEETNFFSRFRSIKQSCYFKDYPNVHIGAEILAALFSFVGFINRAGNSHSQFTPTLISHYRRPCSHYPQVAAQRQSDTNLTASWSVLHFKPIGSLLTYNFYTLFPKVE